MSDSSTPESRDGRVETNPDADLAEVLRDDALLDAIGAGNSLHDAGWMELPDDDVTRLLTAWQVDASTFATAKIQPPSDAPAEMPAATSAATPIEPVADAALTSRRRHARPRRGRRVAPRSAAAISAAAVAGVVLSIGGVAAAVTGSPLTPLKAVVSGFAPAEKDPATDITSVMPRELASVRTDIREGHLDDARRKLTDVRERAEELGPELDQDNALVVIEVLEEQIEMAEQVTPSATSTLSPSASPSESATPTPTPTPTVTSTPTPSATAEPTPSSTSSGVGLGRARSPVEHPESARGGRYDGGPPS